jgi:hypothetical protein
VVLIKVQDWKQSAGWILPVALLLFAGVSDPATGQGKYPYVGTVNHDRVNIRGGPGKNFLVLTSVSKGELVEVCGEGGTGGAWLKCIYPKPLLAYITTEYVKKVSDHTGVLEAQRVHLRPAPNVKRYPLRTLKIGTRLTITGEKNGFYEVVVPDKTFVWIHKDFVLYFGSVQDFRDKLDRIRQDSHKAFLAVNQKGDPLLKTEKPKTGMAKSAGKSDKSALAKAPLDEQDAHGDSAAKKKEDKERREALMVRLEALGKLFEKELARKNLAGLEGVRIDLEKLEKEAAGLEDEYSRFVVGYNVNQLVTKVRLAVVDLQAARRIAEPRPIPNDLKAVGGENIQIAGWLKRDSKVFTKRSVFTLEKGNVVLYHLTTPRYDLDRFVNKHVAITGKIIPRKNLTDNVFLEVTRLKVLSQ